MTVTLADFMSSAPAPLNGNTPWAVRYAGEFKQIITEHAERAPRSLQKSLGPSELGVECDRQVVGKLTGQPRTNHVVDPWPSIVGTAVHKWLDTCFSAYNDLYGVRFAPEMRVYPHPDHGGTADLYDAKYAAVVDHKVLGVTSLGKVSSPGGPPRKYLVQSLMYAAGYRKLGLPVERVVLAAYPRTKSTLTDIYVWERVCTSADDELLAEVWQQTGLRKQAAVAVQSGLLSIEDVPKAPSDDECYFCPFYRPQSARDGLTGCPGPRNTTTNTQEIPR